MQAFKASSFTPFQVLNLNYSTRSFPKSISDKPNLNNENPISCFTSIQSQNTKFKLFTAVSQSISTESRTPFDEETENGNQEEKFDWYAEWYPIMPICDLDKRRPHGKKVMGIDVVVWWDRNEKEWKVMDDACPHRYAPLSEGRIDQWGRLQCVYHGWCFGGSGDCKFIPQAPRDGPPVHTSKRACATVYPSCVQNDILWFWPNSDPLYKDIYLKKRPPYIPELDDSSFSKSFIVRDISYGYELLIENLMDPAHVQYSHYGIMNVPQPPKSVKADREGGRPLDITVTKLDVNSITANQGPGRNTFIAPCLYYSLFAFGGNQGKTSAVSSGAVQEKPSTEKQKKALLVFICIPVSPGHSRIIFASPRNFATWADRIIPRWIFHLGQNLILDSDLYLLHVEEHKLKEIGPYNWHKACYMPTKADAIVVAFRRWLNKYAGGQVDWRAKYNGDLPPTPPREQLLDRYWTHTVNCTSCNLAYKGLNALEIILQIASIGMIGIVAAAKQGTLSMVTRYSLVSVALLCFVGSRWLSHFIYKNFHFHDYDHAFR
ncbi:PREDICTED: protochlorophyllide-dependent translocon component 52, chloroplastic [Nicotiana attenuata]|nr:PREDICTED: protochlorophyllide-dependent translocon component 52, chloroplastic [Nicotiana attenuata]